MRLNCLTNKHSDTIWLMTLCLCQIFIMLVFINYSAVLPLLREEWHMSNTQAGMVFSVYQLGYIVSGVLFSTLSDRVNIKWIFLSAAAWSGVMNLMFALYANDFSSAVLWRGLTGLGMGGTYMPGLKLVAERFESARRGRAIGIYVGALVLGASLSLLVTGMVASHSSWRTAMTVCSISVFIGTIGSFMVFRGYTPVRAIRHPEQTVHKEIITNKPAMLVIAGYASHMWEMYGMRGWLAPFFAASLIQWGDTSSHATALGATIAAGLVGLGTISTAITGSISDAIGRTKTITFVMIGSVSCSMIFGWLNATSLWIMIAVGIVYGWLIVAESPVFSTALTELVSPGYLGAAMGIQSLIGYTMGMISPTVFGWALDRFHGFELVPGVPANWGIAFMTVGLGGAIGPICMYWLRRDPASQKLARGKG